MFASSTSCKTARWSPQTAKNRATKGIGLQVQASPQPKSGGTDSAVNVPAVYVELLDKESEKSLGTHMLTQWVSDRQLLLPGEKVTDEFDDITVADKEYELGLQYHREVKSYWVQLEDVQRTITAARKRHVTIHRSFASSTRKPATIDANVFG